MHGVVDILLLSVWGLMAFWGWRRGFLLSIFSLGRLILAVILTVALGPALAEWLDSTLVYPPVYEAVHEKLTAIAADVASTAQGSVEALVQKLPAVFRAHLRPEDLNPTADVHALADEWSKSVAGGISRALSAVLGYILLLGLCLVLLTLACKILAGLIHRIPLVRTADRLLGLLLGGLGGGIAVLLASAVLGVLLPLWGAESVVESSLLLRLFTDVRSSLFG